MKLNQIVAAILLSTTALGAAADIMDGSAYSVHYCPDGSYKIRRSETSAIVYPNSVIRATADYTVCKTNNPLSQAFRPNSVKVWQRWLSGVEFLLETVGAGWNYAQSLMEEKEINFTQQFIRLLAPLLLGKLQDQVAKILSMLETSDDIAFLNEQQLNCLYIDVLRAIDEIQGSANEDLTHLVATMYVPIRDWMKENFPICDMYKFVTCSNIPLIEGLRQVNYFLDAGLYFGEYLIKSDSYKKIQQYLLVHQKKQEEWNLGFAFFTDSTRITIAESSGG
jgi:hypothetical protein